jgi:hypothetical protein
MPLCAVDHDGNRYTTAVVASEKDWFYGGYGTKILTPSCVRDLKAAGKLPLIEVNPYTGEPLRSEP